MRRLLALWRRINPAVRARELLAVALELNTEAREANTSALDHLSDILGTLESVERLLVEIRDDVAKDRAS